MEAVATGHYCHECGKEVFYEEYDKNNGWCDDCTNRYNNECEDNALLELVHCGCDIFDDNSDIWEDMDDSNIVENYLRVRYGR